MSENLENEKDVAWRITEVASMLGLKEVSPMHDNSIRVMGVVTSGDFTVLGDYNAGLLRIHIGAGPGEHLDGQCQAQFFVGTIDDGGWVARRVMPDKSSAFQLVRRVHESFETTWGVKLPSENRLNEWLREFGMYGTPE